MMHYALLPLAMALGALGRRIAGGVLNQWFAKPGARVFGDTPARLLFGVCVALACVVGML